MAKRITENRLVRFAKTPEAKGGAISTGSVVLVVALLSLILNLGAASVDYCIANEYCGGDEVCWIECYGLEFKNDTFVYPFNASGIVDASPSDQIISGKLFRDWGEGWKLIPLDKTCTGTWCGKSPNVATTVYSYAFREGKTYDIRIEIYKPIDSTIEWNINPSGKWLPLSKKPNVKMKIIESCNITTHEYVQKCAEGNKSCSKDTIIYYNTTTDCKKLLLIGDKTIDYLSQGRNCHVEGNVAICDSFKDGNGDGYCQEQGGETCSRITSDEVIVEKNSEKEWPVKTKIRMNRLVDSKLFVDDKAKYKSLAITEVSIK